MPPSSTDKTCDPTVAGHDSVPAALEFLVRKISEHPDVQAHLQHELRSSLPHSASERTMPMLDSLPYLNAVLMEGLRLVDTILSYETRLVPAGGCVIEGYYLPAGVRQSILFVHFFIPTSQSM